MCEQEAVVEGQGAVMVNRILDSCKEKIPILGLIFITIISGCLLVDVQILNDLVREK